SSGIFSPLRAIIPAAPGPPLASASPFSARPDVLDPPAPLDPEVCQVVRQAAWLPVLPVCSLLLLTPPLRGAPDALRWPGLTGPAAERTVFLCGGLADADLVAFTSAVCASGHPGVVLFDPPRSGPSTRAFLAAFRRECVIPVGSFPQGLAEVEQRLEVKAQPVQTWARGPPAELHKHLFPSARRVVVCPAEPRRL